jgi:ankyrin repeat protein
MLTMGDNPCSLLEDHSICRNVFNYTTSGGDLIRWNKMRGAQLDEFLGFFQETLSHDVTATTDSWREVSILENDYEYEELEEDSDLTSFPVHHLCADLKHLEHRAIRIKQIQMLIESNTKCLLIQDSSGRIPLHHLMNNSSLSDPSCFQLFKRMIRLQPSSVTMRSKNGYTTLHHAVRNRLPSRVVLALVQVDPRLVSMRDFWGDLPLHIACRHFQGDPESVHVLLKAFPLAAFMRNVDGELPLHSACGGIPDLSIIKPLLEVNPRAVSTQNTRGHTPLHQACWQQTDMEVVELFAQIDPNCLLIRDCEKRIPLYNALYWCTVYKKFDIIRLLRLYLAFLPGLIESEDFDANNDPDRVAVVKFVKDSTHLLQQEIELLNTLEWFNNVTSTLSTAQPTVSVADTVTNWAIDHKVQCCKELSMTSASLEIYCQNYIETRIGKLRDTVN